MFRLLTLLLALLIFAVPGVLADDGTEQAGDDDSCRPIEAAGEEPSLSLYPILGIWRLDIQDCIDGALDETATTTASTTGSTHELIFGLPP